VHKRTEATLKTADGKALEVTNGAPQAILELSANAVQIKSAVGKAVNEFAARGFRWLDVARTEAQGQWQFLGLLPLFDPPREDSKVTVATEREMGGNVKMVTGDQMAIGREIAKKLGLGAGGVRLRPRLVPGERSCKTGSVSHIQLSTVSAIRKRQ
jgi:H+-transporting ATPase